MEVEKEMGENILKVVDKWNYYLTQEPTFELFLQVAEIFNSELGLICTFNYKYQSFFEELCYWIKISIKNRGKELVLLLKSLKNCIKHNLYSIEKLHESVKLLYNTLLTPDITTSFDCIQNYKIFKTLLTFIKNAKLLPLLQNPNEFIQNSIISITSLALFYSDRNLNHILLNSLSKMTQTKEKIYLIEHKSILSILELIKKTTLSISSNTLNPINHFDSIDLSNIASLLKLFLFENLNGLQLIGLDSAIILLVKCKNEEINAYLVKILKEKLCETSCFTVENEIKKLVVALATEDGLSRELYFEIIRDLNEGQWFHEKETLPARADVKRAVLACKDLWWKRELVDLVLPWLREGLDLEEVKLMMKQINVDRELFYEFVDCMKSAVAKTKNFVNFYKISPGSSIQVSFIKPLINLTKYSVCFSIYQNILYQDTFISISFSKSLILSINLTNEKLKVQVTKSSKSSILLNESISLLHKTWNSISITSTPQKNSANIYINKQKFDLSHNFFSGFKSISSIQVTGKLRIKYIKVFKDFYQNIASDSKQFLIFNLNPDQHPYSQFPFEISCSAKLIEKSKSSEIICNPSIFIYFLPLIKRQEGPKVFVLFFELLAELALCDKFLFVFDDKFMFLLREIMIEKVKFANMELLDSCESFLIRVRDGRLYVKVVVNFYLCPQIWIGLDAEDFRFYLESIKTHLNSEFFVGFDEYSRDVLMFFVNLFQILEENMKKIVFYYFFLVFSSILKRSEKGKAGILIELLTAIEDLNDPSITEEYLQFLKIFEQATWPDLSELEFYQLIQVLSHSKYQGKIKSKQLSISLSLLKSFYFLHIHLTPKPVQRSFISRSLSILNSTISSLDLSEHIESLLIFFQDPDIIQSELSKSIMLLKNNLIHSMTCTASLDQNIQILINHFSNSTSLSKIMINKSDFPCWSIPLFKPSSDSSKILQFLLSVFSHFKLFNNFDLHRHFLFDLINLSKFSEIFEFLTNLLKFCFEDVKKHKISHKYLIEFFNLTEDVVGRIDYKDLPVDEFVAFVQVCVDLMKIFRFSSNFTHLPGLETYKCFERFDGGIGKLRGSYRGSFLDVGGESDEGFNFDKWNFNSDVIGLRDGGIARQIGFIVLVGMSFAPNQAFENFLNEMVSKCFGEGEDRAEWKGLEKDLKVKRFEVCKKSQKSSENLIYLYIFHEWALLIHKYSKSTINQSQILQSVSNFLFFTKQFQLENRILSESSILQDKSTYKLFEKLRNENLHKMKDHILGSPNKNFELLVRANLKNESLSSLANYNDYSKNQDFYSKIIFFASNLEKCNKTHKFLEVLKDYWKNIEVQSFFIVLTTLKLTFLSSIYFFKPPECPFLFKDEENDQRSSFDSRIEVVEKTVKNCSFFSDFWMIEQKFKEFCKGFEEKQGGAGRDSGNSLVFYSANQSFELD